MSLRLGVISLMPEMFGSLSLGITGRALEKGLVQLDCWNPRDWATGAYRQVDDKPYGGGPGMVMMYEPLHATISYARTQMPAESRVIYLSPQGRVVDQMLINEQASRRQPLIFVAGRYEGIDERVLQRDVDEEWSLGNFVLSGGELAAMVIIDAIIRLLPGSLGHAASAAQDSFMKGLLDYPHYTRPASVDGLAVPEVLLRGNHKEIEIWQRKQALGQTWLKRPELLDTLDLSDSDKQLLLEFEQDYGKTDFC